MKKRWVRVTGVAIAAFVLILVALPFLINVNSFRPKIEEDLSASLGRKVTLGNLNLFLFSGTVEADDIAIADDPAFSASPFVTASLLKVGVELNSPQTHNQRASAPLREQLGRFQPGIEDGRNVGFRRQGSVEARYRD